MRPDECEFKVMELAAFAKSSYVKQAKLAIDDLCAVDGMRIISKNRPLDLFSYLVETMKYRRTISWPLSSLINGITVKWAMMFLWHRACRLVLLFASRFFAETSAVP